MPVIRYQTGAAVKFIIGEFQQEARGKDTYIERKREIYIERERER